MKSILILFSLFSVLLLPEQANNTAKETDTNSSWNDSLELKKTVFFSSLSILFPPSYYTGPDAVAGNTSDLLHFDSPDQTVWIKLRRDKSSVNLESTKKMSESMATKFYKGEIHKSEYLTINGHSVYYLEMSGYWNKSKVKESWIRFYTIHNGYTYSALYKFPEKQLNSSIELRKKIMNSIDFI